MLEVKSFSKLIFCGFILGLLPVAMASGNPAGPEAKTARQAKELVSGKHSMVVTNNPWASKAAQKILSQGGSAVDAAIAAGFVLGLTEPQSSGIGGGGYALTYTSKNNKMRAYDGREVAPDVATPEWFVAKDGKPLDFEAAHVTAQAIGVPGEVALFYKMHQEQGKLAWAKLLQPAIDLAEKGFPMSPRLFGLLETEHALLSIPEVKALYYTEDDEVKPVGTIIVNTAYAESLRRIARDPHDFYNGELADDIIHAINTKAKGEIYTSDDLAKYKVLSYSPVCNEYRGQYKICSVPPSSSGGVTVLELMGIYSNVYNGHDIKDTNWAYYFLEASKLAFADRNQYLADPDFVKQPIAGLLDNQYIKARSELISGKALATPVAAGEPEGIDEDYAPDTSPKVPGTTSVAVVDKNGNAITMTVTIENQFGSHTFVDGFFLNNELTDFSLAPTDANGKAVANRVEGGKRPRSSIAPTLVLDNKNNLKMLVGSPGGSQIICYVAKNLIQMIDLGQNPLQAASSGNLCSVNGKPMLEDGTSIVDISSMLEERGDEVNVRDLVSGEVNILRTKNSWLGAADPRREGIALGN